MISFYVFLSLIRFISSSTFSLSSTLHTFQIRFFFPPHSSVLISFHSILSHVISLISYITLISSLSSLSPYHFLSSHSSHQVGEEGLCKSSIFLSYPFGDDQRDSGLDAAVKSSTYVQDKDTSSKAPARKEGKKSKDIHHSDVIIGSVSNVTDNSTVRCTFNVAVCGVAVECGGCGIKLGRFSPQDSPCSCGILVPGPALRITATKVNQIKFDYIK